MTDIIAIFITFFAVIDPIGTIPVFIAVTARHSKLSRSKIAMIASLVAAAVLLFFALLGEILLNAMGVSLFAFQLAGGVILFLFAITMIFGESKPDSELKIVASESETAIFPLAIPSIASPGAMLAAVLMTSNKVHGVFDQLLTITIMLSVVAVAFTFMMLAGYLHRIMGTSGASIISRVMGLILSAVAAENILNGIKGFFNL